MKTLIEAHKTEVLHEDSTYTYRITVRCSHMYIYEETLVALRAGFDERRHLCVTFLTEFAVDGGGPRREFS